MPEAVIQELADFVVEQINANAATFGTWGADNGTIAATRVYRIKKDLTDAPGITGVPLVQVSFYDETMQLLNRELASLRTLALNVCIIQNVNPDDNSQCDPLVALSDQLVNFFIPIGVQIGSHRYALSVIEKPALYLPEDLDQEAAFVSVTRFIYQLAM
jgi:hypothetical protein